MDLQLNLTGVPADRVARILAFASREISRNDDTPDDSHRRGNKVVEWAEKRARPFSYADVVEAFPGITDVKRRDYVRSAYRSGGIVRVRYGVYQAANCG